MTLKNVTRYALKWAKRTGLGGQFTLPNALALAMDHYAFSRQGKAVHFPMELAKEYQTLIGEIEGRGFSAIKNFISKSDCERLRNILMKQLAENLDLLHPSTRYDLRLHGVEYVDATFMDFSKNPLLEKIASTYLKRPVRTAFTLGASLQAVEGNPGSGGGWHRDSLTHQFKAMLYLTDVSPENGPFQILESSHHLWQTIKDNRAAQLPYGQVRMTQEQVDEVLENSSHERLHTLSFPAGTLLIFDSSAIHRGCPIKAGTRLALTNYYFPESQINSELYQHFHPVAGHLPKETVSTEEATPCFEHLVNHHSKS